MLNSRYTIPTDSIRNVRGGDHEHNKHISNHGVRAGSKDNWRTRNNNKPMVIKRHVKVS